MLAESPNLLITDDDASLRETLASLLEPRGFRTYLARDGREAIEIVQSQPIHLMLIDLHMPRIGGLETLRRLNTLNATPPCIVMSAGLDDATVAEVRQARAYSVLAKPVTCDQVTQTVAAAMWDAYGWRWQP
jgi:CheY-like chemotaxis protein